MSISVVTPQWVKDQLEYKQRLELEQFKQFVSKSVDEITAKADKLSESNRDTVAPVLVMFNAVTGLMLIGKLVNVSTEAYALTALLGAFVKGKEVNNK